MQGNVFLIILGGAALLLVLFNAVLLVFIFTLRRKWEQVNSWPPTQGVVTASTLESRHSMEGGRVEYPAVRYSYQVGQQAFQGTRIVPGPGVRGWGSRKVAQRYATGAPVTVYYNPQNPSEAVLERRAAPQTWMWVLLGLFDALACAALSGLWWMFSQ